jgi:hypothetical protein
MQNVLFFLFGLAGGLLVMFLISRVELKIYRMEDKTQVRNLLESLQKFIGQAQDALTANEPVRARKFLQSMWECLEKNLQLGAKT